MPPSARSAPPDLTPTILLHSLPPKTFVGVNLLSFTSSPSFHGIKNLTPGYHFIYAGADASFSIRHGHWFHISPASTLQLFILHWNSDLEYLEHVSGSSAAAQNAQASLNRIWERGLVSQADLANASTSGQQDDEGHNAQADDTTTFIQWNELTDFISEEMLSRILKPDITSETATGTTAESTYSISSISSAACDTEPIPGLSDTEAKLDGESELNFLAIDLKKTWREGAVGRERTESALDRSWYFGDLLDRMPRTGGDRKIAAAQVLGEMQFCFLMVLTLANWSCLQQWKRIVGLLLSCRKAVGEIEEYFVRVVKLLRVQLAHCEDVEGGLFELREEGAGGWLRSLLSGFKKGAEDVIGKEGPVWGEIKILEDLMNEIYGWDAAGTVLRRGHLELEDGERVEMDMDGADEEDETGDYAPMIVDLG